MAEDDLPDFLQPNGFRVKPGMFGARSARSVPPPVLSDLVGQAPWSSQGVAIPGRSFAPPYPAATMTPWSNLPSGLSIQSAPAARAAGRPRRSTLTGLSIGKDQLEDWISEINQSGGLDEPEPGPNTLNSDRAVARAMAHAATDKGGADTIEDPDLDNFVDRFRQAEGKLRLNGLKKGQRPEIFFTMGRDDKGQVVLRSLQAVGRQGQRAPTIPADAIAIGHSHTTDIPAPPHAGDASYLYATGKPSFVIGQRNLDLYQIERHAGKAQIRLVRPGGRFAPWERFQTDPNQYRIYDGQ